MASTNSATWGLARGPAAWGMSLDTGSARGRGFRAADEEGAVKDTGLPSEDARMIAERAHRGQIEPSGQPYIDHVRRVVAKVPAEAASVAWLHDVLEWTELTEDEPALRGPHPAGADGAAPPHPPRRGR